MKLKKLYILLALVNLFCFFMNIELMVMRHKMSGFGILWPLISLVGLIGSLFAIKFFNRRNEERTPSANDNLQRRGFADIYRRMAQRQHRSISMSGLGGLLSERQRRIYMQSRRARDMELDRILSVPEIPETLNREKSEAPIEIPQKSQKKEKEIKRRIVRNAVEEIEI